MAILGIAVMDRQSPVSANADSLIKDSQVASLRVEIVTWRLPAMATSVHFTLKGFDQLPVKWVGWEHAEGDGQPLPPRRPGISQLSRQA